jgi:hypothetical protein
VSFGLPLTSGIAKRATLRKRRKRKMIDWKHLAAEAARLEADLVRFLASIERPGGDADAYANFYGALETALESIGDARALAQKAAE